MRRDTFSVMVSALSTFLATRTALSALLEASVILPIISVSLVQWKTVHPAWMEFALNVLKVTSSTAKNVPSVPANVGSAMTPTTATSVQLDTCGQFSGETMPTTV